VLCSVCVTDKHKYDFALLRNKYNRYVPSDLSYIFVVYFYRKFFVFLFILFHGPKKGSILEPIQIQSPVINTNYNKKVSTRDVLICFYICDYSRLFYLEFKWASDCYSDTAGLGINV
jgi:hypothetical protein